MRRGRQAAAASTTRRYTFRAASRAQGGALRVVSADSARSSVPASRAEHRRQTGATRARTTTAFDQSQTSRFQMRHASRWTFPPAFHPPSCFALWTRSHRPVSISWKSRYGRKHIGATKGNLANLSVLSIWSAFDHIDVSSILSSGPT